MSARIKAPKANHWVLNGYIRPNWPLCGRLLSDKFSGLCDHFQLRLLCLLPFKPSPTFRRSQKLTGADVTVVAFGCCCISRHNCPQVGPPLGHKGRLQKIAVTNPDAEIPYQMVPKAIGDHYVPCWVHNERRSVATSADSFSPFTEMMTPCHGFLSGSLCDPVDETMAEPDSFPIRLVFPTLRLFIRCNVISTCCIMERRTKREPH